MVTVFRSRTAGPSSLRLTHLNSTFFAHATQGIPITVGAGVLYPSTNFPVLIPTPQAFVPGALRAPQAIAQVIIPRTLPPGVYLI